MAAPTLEQGRPKRESPFSIVCLSSQDWAVDLPTNRQQIMLRAARLGHRVLFIETGGFLGIHLARLLFAPGRRSLTRRVFAVEQVAPCIAARKALNLFPWGQRFALANRVNNALTGLLLRLLTRRLPSPRVSWIYDPCAVQAAAAACPAAVYDCVDDYAEQVQGARRRAFVAECDRRAARASIAVFATTGSLYERQRRLNPRTHHVPNVGDYVHFASAAERSLAAEDVRNLPRPVLGFAGNFLASKVDFELLSDLASTRPDWTVLLVGPARPETRQALERLGALANVRWVGPRSYAELPRYVAAFDVGLIPYLRNAYTLNCFPLKLYEYLAAGKPVVASGLAELEGMEPDVVVTDDVTSFAAAIEDALGRLGEDDRRRRMLLASANTWEARTERLLALVTSHLPS